MDKPKLKINSAIINSRMSPYTLIKSDISFTVESKISNDELTFSRINSDDVISEILKSHKHTIIQKIKEIIGIDDELRKMLIQLAHENDIRYRFELLRKIEDKLFNDDKISEQIVIEVRKQLEDNETKFKPKWDCEYDKSFEEPVEGYQPITELPEDYKLPEEMRKAMFGESNNKNNKGEWIC